MTQKFSDQVAQRDFANAKKSIEKLTLQELHDLIMEAGYELEEESIYSFVLLLLEQNETAILHELAANLMMHPLCFLDDAYLTAKKHIEQALELEPTNVALLEYMLFLYITPDEVVTQEEVVQYATRILSIEPDNQPARELMSKQ